MEITNIDQYAALSDDARDQAFPPNVDAKCELVDIVRKTTLKGDDLAFVSLKVVDGTGATPGERYKATFNLDVLKSKDPNDLPKIKRFISFIKAINNTDLKNLASGTPTELATATINNPPKGAVCKVTTRAMRNRKGNEYTAISFNPA